MGVRGITLDSYMASDSMQAIHLKETDWVGSWSTKSRAQGELEWQPASKKLRITLDNRPKPGSSQIISKREPGTRTPVAEKKKGPSR
ncbi:hypothetical protein Pcinc_025131 [Petrolisthes cinctipes]|uniref:Uncharacterized protein n=1 Tax=Petrolisthes cinctipes TaxID=88211 RepID=A0AAE1F943_PETCI|nr:hypothetical protein Pcinc_025131 [Petrolisthes cinctipes]